MSKLLEKLERSAKGSPTRLGFGPATSREKVPPVIFVGAIAKEHTKGAKALAQAGGDAVVLRVPRADSPEVGQLQKSLDNLPWGLWAEHLEGEKVEDLKKQGCDFLVLDAERTPLEAVEEGDTARILAVRADMEERLLHTLEDLPVDAILLQLPDTTFPLTLHHLMLISVVRGMTFKYLLLERPSLPTTRELELLRDAGVDGLVVDVAATTIQELSQFRQQLQDLPKRKLHGERLTPTLPQPRAGLPIQREEQEEEEEEEDI